jgi:hypothetical protein
MRWAGAPRLVCRNTWHGLDPAVQDAALGPGDEPGELLRMLARLDWDIPAAPYARCDHQRKCWTAAEHHGRVRAVLRGPWGVADPPG